MGTRTHLVSDKRKYLECLALTEKCPTGSQINDDQPPEEHMESKIATRNAEFGMNN